MSCKKWPLWLVTGCNIYLVKTHHGHTVEAIFKRVSLQCFRQCPFQYSHLIFSILSYIWLERVILAIYIIIITIIVEPQISVYKLMWHEEIDWKVITVIFFNYVDPWWFYSTSLLMPHPVCTHLFVQGGCGFIITLIIIILWRRNLVHQRRKISH